MSKSGRQPNGSFYGKDGKLIIPSPRTLAKLKPCPFCGCKQVDLLSQKYGWLVVCRNRCGGQKLSHSRYVLSAVYGWNMRMGGVT